MSAESLRAVFISNLAYFSNESVKLYGMTGTIGSKSERELLKSVYKVDFFNMPRNTTRKYKQLDPLIALSQQ